MASKEQLKDHHILKTIQEWQGEKDRVLGGLLYEHLLSSSEIITPDGPISFKSKLEIGNRMTVFYDKNFIALQPGNRDELRGEGFFGVTLTAAGEAALQRGSEKLLEEPKTVSNSYSFGRVNAGQFSAGDHNTQNQNVTITLGQLMQAAEAAVAEADLPDEAKEEAKSFFERFKEVMALGSAASTIGKTAAAVLYGAS